MTNFTLDSIKYEYVPDDRLPRARLRDGKTGDIFEATFYQGCDWLNGNVGLPRNRSACLNKGLEISLVCWNYIQTNS